MLSKNDIKYIRSLDQVKYRRKHKCFIAEGRKVINEFVDSGHSFQKIFTTRAEDFQGIENVIEVSDRELKQASYLSSPQGSLALIDMPDHHFPKKDAFIDDYGIVCDCIQDPGNLGTIIRIADWFGIQNVVCSIDTVDAYNPKVVQASMGSLARVNVSYVEMNDWMLQLHESIPIIASSLEGKNVYEMTLPKNGLLVLGNESKGISEEVLKKSTIKAMIPRWGGAESLNVAVSAGIFCAELRRVK